MAAAQASIQNIDAQISVQKAQISANKAQVEQAEAGLVFAAAQAARYQDLAQKGAGTVQNASSMILSSASSRPRLPARKLTLKVAQRQIESLKAQRSSAESRTSRRPSPARPGATQSLLYDGDGSPARARRQPRAPPSVNSRAGHGADHVRPDQIWVTANFKETQLDAMRPGRAGRR